MKGILTHQQELKEKDQPNAGFPSLAAEYFSKSNIIKLFLQAHMYPPSRQSWSPLLLYSQSSSESCYSLVPIPLPISVLEMLLTAYPAYTSSRGFGLACTAPTQPEGQWLGLEQLLSSFFRWFSEGQEPSLPRRTIRG